MGIKKSKGKKFYLGKPKKFKFLNRFLANISKPEKHFGKNGFFWYVPSIWETFKKKISKNGPVEVEMFEKITINRKYYNII
jgi:hypothetical protein